MKRGIFVLACVLLVILAWGRKRVGDRPPPQTQEPGPVRETQTQPVETVATPEQAKPQRPTNRFTKRASEFTPAERDKLAQDFEEKYKPVVHKWFASFQGRVPFAESDFTLDKFHSRMGVMFTFMIGSTTFTIQDSPQAGVKVGYLMTRSGAVQMNSLPSNGAMPNLTPPVTREEVIQMVKDDLGREFKPNEVLIHPTAAGTALDGGAFVDIVPEGTDPNNAITHAVNMVFGSDGKLVNYTRISL